MLLLQYLKIYFLLTGDIIPACGLLIHGNSLRVKEKQPNGTVHFVVKDVFKDPILRSGKLQKTYQQWIQNCTENPPFICSLGSYAKRPKRALTSKPASFNDFPRLLMHRLKHCLMELLVICYFCYTIRWFGCTMLFLLHCMDFLLEQSSRSVTFSAYRKVTPY